jgi:V/A-type H+-transporting ATPase subunit A
VGRVVGARESFVVVGLDAGAAVRKNEVAHVLVGPDRLKSEVLRIRGREADLQVFEDTRGVRVGDTVEFSGELLAATLGPGLLGTVFDGLQNPLRAVAQRHGVFLPRGVALPALDLERKRPFTPLVRPGDILRPGQAVGTVPEGTFAHRIMVPFHLADPVEVTWVSGERAVAAEDAVARCRTRSGQEITVCPSQRWPVRRPLPEELFRRRHAERLYPTEALTTGCRIIDAFFPVARGGTACIPGPFGAGKTVLQSSIARYSDIDIVVIVACGERAGEVSETLTTFPNLRDPRGGGSLMDRTVIVCNTSSMPVAAREASIYLGVTVAEYYRQMGYSVLLLADSTSRWAQAMREISGRMEEIPGEEAFPAYLDSSIKGIYERAGAVRGPDGRTGTLTMIGTVSPAGGNFEEPVTQSTLGTVKTFLGLSRDRAYKRFYPAVDPLVSWSRYWDQLGGWFAEALGPDWTDTVRGLQQLLRDGDAVQQIMQVTGEEGITLDDYVLWQKAQFLDFAFLQQDAFDAVDGATSRERQATSLRRIRRIVESPRRFADKDEARVHFTRLTNLFRNWNYAPAHSPDAQRWWEEIDALAGT